MIYMPVVSHKIMYGNNDKLKLNEVTYETFVNNTGEINYNCCLNNTGYLHYATQSTCTPIKLLITKKVQQVWHSANKFFSLSLFKQCQIGDYDST